MHNRMQSEITVERAITTGIFILLGVAIFCVSLLAGFTMAENTAKDSAIEWQVARNEDLKVRNVQLTTASDIGSIFSFMFPDLRARVSEVNHKLKMEANKKGLRNNWGS